MIDFIGYLGTVTLLSTKELLDIKIDWFATFNHIACGVGALCTVLFTVAGILIYRKYNATLEVKKADEMCVNAQYSM